MIGRTLTSPYQDRATLAGSAHRPTFGADVSYHLEPFLLLAGGDLPAGSLGPLPRPAPCAGSLGVCHLAGPAVIRRLGRSHHYPGRRRALDPAVICRLGCSDHYSGRRRRALDRWERVISPGRQ